jgi:hypothetical protein
MGRGPGKLGGEVAVTVVSQVAPNALEVNKRVREKTDAAFRTPDLTDGLPECFRLDSKVGVCEVAVEKAHPNAEKSRGPHR